jgi:aquaporin Z
LDELNAGGFAAALGARRAAPSPSGSASAKLSVRQALRTRWPEYLIEAWALGIFMLSASVVTTLLEYPGAALHGVIDARWRLALIGLAMGSTAVALIYSPWGRRSGAHMNPSVTLAFLTLGRISVVDAVFYMLAQFVGGLLGVLVSWGLLGKPFALPPVSFIATVPGSAGMGVAFLAEAGISLLLMLAILEVSNHRRWSPYSGLVAGCLIACYVFFESPLSGMSMNPARSLASAWPGGIWTGLGIYFTAPCLGMWLAARIFHTLTPWATRLHHSAKIVHTPE